FDAVGRLLRDQNDAIVPAIVRELRAKTVDDAAARRRNEMLADAICFGLDLVLVAVADLELVEAPGEHGEDGGHASGHHQRTAAEGRVATLIFPVEGRHQSSLRSGPTKRRWTKFRNAAIGI